MKFGAFCSTQMFITLFTGINHLPVI